MNIPMAQTKPFLGLESVLSEWERGEDPVNHLQTHLTSDSLPLEIRLEAYRRWGNGASPWLLLAWVAAEKMALRSTA